MPQQKFSSLEGIVIPSMECLFCKKVIVSELSRLSSCFVSHNLDVINTLGTIIGMTYFVKERL